MSHEQEHIAVISLGSNIHPHENIDKALQIIAESYQLLKKSRFIKTKPVGYSDQPDFINGSVLIATTMNLNHLRAFLSNIESQLKRIRTSNKFGPRTIDLDVTVWDHEIIDADVYLRDYLKNAVAELLPELF